MAIGKKKKNIRGVELLLRDLDAFVEVVIVLAGFVVALEFV